MEYNFDEIEFEPEPDHHPLEQSELNFESLFDETEDNCDRQCKQPELKTKRSKFTFKKLGFALVLGAVLACKNALPVSGSLGRRWSSVLQPTFELIEFSELRECGFDVVCAAPLNVPEGMHFEAKDLPAGLKLDPHTGLLKGPASVDALASFTVQAVMPQSWFGASVYMQTVEVRQHASRTPGESVETAVADAVASGVSFAMGVVSMYCLDALFA
jgi:hypothetical protein